MYNPNSTGGAVSPTAMKRDSMGTYQSPGPKSAFSSTPWRSRTYVTMNVPTRDMLISTAVIRRGTSDAASVYRPTRPIRKPISAGVVAIETSTTAIGHRRRTSSTAPATSPNTTPKGTGSPASPAKSTPSSAHSSAETSASPTSSATLRRRSHHQ